MKVVDNGKGDGSEVLGTTKEEVIVSGDDAEYIYKLVSGALANKSFVSDGAKYDTTLTLGLAIKNLDIAFTNSRTYVLSGDELAEYTNMDDVDRFTLSETIDITTQFKAGKENDIDLSAVLKAFLPSLTDEQLLVIKAQADDGGDVNRSVQLVVDADIQIAALLNYMRTELVKYAGDDDQFDGDMDLFTVLELLKRSSKTSSLPNLSTSSQTLQATSISLSDCKPRAATTANITICSASTWSAARSRFLPTRRETTFTANTTSIRARDTITISKPRTAATILQRTARTNTSAQASLQAQDTPTIQAIATRTKG